MKPLNPNDQRSKTAIILIWIVLTIEIISLISSFFQLNLLQSVADGGTVTIDEANANDTREQIIAIVFMVAYLVSAITFIMWFRRAYFNLHQRVNHLADTEGWAAGSWFIPIFNLFKPFQIMRELYRETRVLLSNNGIMNYEALSTKFLGWWWGLWIFNGFMGNISFRMSRNAETVDQLISWTQFNIFTSIIFIPLALITVKLIMDYSNVEPLLLEIREEVVVVENAMVEPQNSNSFE